MGFVAEDDMEDFVQNLQSAADRIHLSDDEKHVAVKLLAFSSQESDHDLDTNDRDDIENLKDIFANWYGFHIELFIIPKTHSAVTVSQFLVKAEIEHRENKGRLARMKKPVTSAELSKITGLLIVVYVGNAVTCQSQNGWDKITPGSLVFYPSADIRWNNSQCLIDWAHQQKHLENSAFDTLIILDTCDGGSAFRLAAHEGPGSLEFLTACGFSRLAPVGPNSFSAALCSTLRDMATDSFTISRLYERLLRSQMKLRYTPFYARLSEHGPAIQLQSVKAKDLVAQDPKKIRTILLNVNVIPAQDGLKLMPWIDWIKSYAPRKISGMEVTSNRASGRYCFNIRVRLMASSIPDYALWNRWIDHAPANLQSITFDIEQASLKSDEDSVASFVAQLNFNLGINENLGQRYYQSVTVLPVMWKKPTTNYLKPEERKRNDTELAEIRDELKGISDIFKDEFHYHTKSILELSADDSDVARYELIDEINDLTRMHGRGTNSLLIIIYGGHGEDTRYSTSAESECIWAANVSPMSAWVNWTTCGINLLEGANCDTLMILDCCHSGSATRGVSRNTTEILAGATRNEPSWSGQRAYSKLLRRKLKEKSVRPFTAFELHEEMLAASKAPLSGDPNNLEATSDHGFTPRSRMTSILFKPLDQGTVQTITNNRPFAPELPNRRIFLEVELDQLQGLEDCVSE